MTTSATLQIESLSRARGGMSVTNYPAIINGFSAMGIPMDDIRPRENVFTFQAWKALGRTVRKGEHGIKVITFAPMTKTNKETGERESIGQRPWTTTVFHISQTDTLPAA